MMSLCAADEYVWLAITARKSSVCELYLICLKQSCSDELHQTPSALFPDPLISFFFFFSSHTSLRHLGLKADQSACFLWCHANKYLSLIAGRAPANFHFIVPVKCCAPAGGEAPRHVREGGYSMGVSTAPPDKYVWLHHARFPALYANDPIQL